MFFAGGDSIYTTLEQNEVEKILTTYYFLRRKSKRTWDRISSTFSPIFLDSGAFSFKQFSEEEGIRWRDIPKRPEFREYVEQYGNFVKAEGERYYACANVDVGGIEDKERNQRILEEITGYYIVPVIHPSDPIWWVDKVFREYPYVGLGGVGSEKNEKKILRYCKQRLSHAKQYGTRVHGFALTSIDLMRSVAFFSVDSTSWIAGAKYGVTYFFDSRRLRMWDRYQKKVRGRMKPHVIELGLDWDKYKNEESRTVNSFNLQQWRKFAYFCEHTPYKINQTYWDTGEGEHWIELLEEKRKKNLTKMLKPSR